MISLDHGYLRSADVDDAAALQRLYTISEPRAALLDKAREPMLPTRDELAIMLTKKDIFKTGLYVIDTPEGEIPGFGALRGLVHDARYVEMSLLLYDTSDFSTPLINDVFTYFCKETFERFQLYKMITQCLDSETAWSAFLQEKGFERCGEQRQVLFAGGKWHNLLTYALYHPDGERVFSEPAAG